MHEEQSAASPASTQPPLPGTSRTLLSATCSPLQTTSPASVQAPVGALWVNSAARREGREHGTSAQHPPLPGQVNLTQWKVFLSPCEEAKTNEIFPLTWEAWRINHP